MAKHRLMYDLEDGMSLISGYPDMHSSRPTPQECKIRNSRIKVKQHIMSVQIDPV